MEDPASIKQHKKAGLTMSFMDNKELGEPIKKQEAFCRDAISQLDKQGGFGLLTEGFFSLAKTSVPWVVGRNQAPGARRA